jgi:zinc protease
VPARAAEPDNVLRATLPNGLQVVVVPNKLAPVVTTELNYLVGSNDAPEGFPGTAHALEHMMFRGSEGLAHDQLIELGALLGGNYNADTTETVTQYLFTVPAADLGIALRIEALRMRGLSLNQADWEQERGAIEQEVARDLSSPMYRFHEQLQGILFAGTPLDHDALGTRPSFDRTDAALLRRFYDQWYAPNNAILVIAGDVEPTQALTQAQAAFGDIPSRPVPAHAPVNPGAIKPANLSFPTNLPLGLVALAWRFPGLTAADFAAADVLADVLGSQRGSIYGLVPAGRALMAGFDFEAKADAGVATAYAGFPKGGDPEPLLADLRRIIAATRDLGVRPELVEAAKQQEIAQLAFGNDSIGGLAASWSHALAFRHAGSPQDLAGAYAAVTLADVNRLAKLLLDPDAAVTAVLTPQSSGQPVSQSGFGGTESFGGAPPDEKVALPDWAAAALDAVHLPEPVAPPDVSVLPNGLRLVVQPEHVGHTVSVFGHVRHVPEMQEPKGKEGVAALTAQLFAYGTIEHDRLAFRKAVDDIAARLSAGPDFALRVLTPQFEAGMRLLAENELHPAFPQAAFEVVRTKLAQGLAGTLESPNYLFSRAQDQALVPAGDPSLREATPTTVSALQRDDVTAFYAAAYLPSLTTIVVLGDVTPEHARAVVAETFGAWQAPAVTPEIDLPPIGPSKPADLRVPDSSSVQDEVSLSETIGLPVDSPERYTLMLGNFILGSGFSSRLYRDLRLHSGYVYSVSSALDWSRTRADYTVSFGADPDNVEKARALVARDIKQMQNEPVSNAELNLAKAQVLRRLPMQRASIGAIAQLYLRLFDLGLPLDATERAAAHYLTTTAPQIQQAFATWLRVDDLATVVKGPVSAP